MTTEFKTHLHRAIESPLTRADAKATMLAILDGDANEAQIAALLGAIQARGVTRDELTGFAEALIARCVTVDCNRRPLLDNCGTGGDALNTFNISTAAAFVAAGAGVNLAKHGNRSVSSKSGSADVLEALGVAIDDGPAEISATIDRVGIGFCFAPRFHPALKTVGPIRRALGVRTVFNLLGPIVNPAPITHQVVGIFDPARLDDYAHVLLALGREKVMVVHGNDGMDELSLTGPTRAAIGNRETGVTIETIRPEDAGLNAVSLADLRGGEAAENAEMLEKILTGEPGPLTDATLLNAAASIHITGISATLRDGVEAAREAISNGNALAILNDLRAANSESRP